MKSYLKFLSRNKLYTFINVSGLIVSMMFIILIGDYTWRQYRIDTWHKNADRIYLMGNEESFHLWPDAANAIQSICPEIEKICHVVQTRGRIVYGERSEEGDLDESTSNIMLSDSNFFQFFDFELIKGDAKTALDAPDKCVITESLAKSLFGDKDPMGKSLRIGGYGERIRASNGACNLEYTVSGVIKDFEHTALPHETKVIANTARCENIIALPFSDDWLNFAGTYRAFAMLRPGVTFDGKLKMVTDYLTKNYRAWSENFFSDEKKQHEFTMTPLTDIKFAPQNDGNRMVKGDKTRYYILLTAVLAILFFAITNYVNLTVANTGFRAKEMATRRLFGSNQWRITLKLIAESTLMVAIAFAIGLFMAFCFQQDASNLFRGEIDLVSDFNLITASICVGFILLVGILSGIMPSLQMARFQPIDIVKGNFRYHSKMVLGKVFIILQNVVTVVMLTMSLVVWLQLHHLIDAPLGYNTENLFYLRIFGYEENKEDNAIKIRDRLEKMPFVEKIGTCYWGDVFTEDMNIFSSDLGALENITLDSAAFNIYGLEILEDYGPTNNGMYLNEKAMQLYANKIENHELKLFGDSIVSIAGVLKNFHLINVLRDYDPYAIRIEESNNHRHASYLIKTNGDKRAKAAFAEVLTDLGCPEGDLKHSLRSLHEDVENSFEDQRNTLKIISLFTIIAIIISVMGFVGMSLFFIRQRQKEIGLRKIMGGTSREVTLLMLRTFCAPLLVSFVIAVPISYYIMNDWLNSFSYRITLSPWIFAATCVFSLLVAVLSVGFQIVKAVRTNPVESIKTE